MSEVDSRLGERIARLESRVDELARNQDRTFNEFRAFEEKLEKFQAETRGAISEMSLKFQKVIWMGIGGLAVVQLLIQAVQILK